MCTSRSEIRKELSKNFQKRIAKVAYMHVHMYNTRQLLSRMKSQEALLKYFTMPDLSIPWKNIYTYKLLEVTAYNGPRAESRSKYPNIFIRGERDAGRKRVDGGRAIFTVVEESFSSALLSFTNKNGNGGIY